MILLESHNVVIQNTLAEKFNKPGSIDVVFVDFDGVRFRLSTPTSKEIIVLSMNIRCWDELAKYGVTDVLQREYGSRVMPQPEADYHVSLEYAIDSIPPPGEERDALIKAASLLKRNALAAPFENAFATQKTLESSETSDLPGQLMEIHYRDEEAIYIQAANDRVTVVFSTIFKDETDRTFGKVFLQEFVDARRQNTAMQHAPQVLYSSRDPPLEIRNVAGLKRSDDVGYVTFVLFPQHFSNPERMQSTISHIQLFRDYLHYHIKCSKAYMHSRMRARVAEFLKVLNRAKMENKEVERKTVTGRTLVQR
ncbi:Actin-related protein 2/3 complex subunit 2 AltName: Full=Arp2/3 complex 34 kDa subunit; Short=p34-ARC [Serendipita indica DSM 11827]|uniref:Arp2/3 complex 34 kDa subunit n=1 Tax=Serendipita indica (strain DSM 11827) TaxID=1109443 RepID=G4TRR4_SERID|nr:Actin-related protein 2/3 complex subunit 2 AltName: Full=Arp2/3 complex 34 kDa subunit; Short=p34-ARC [Serendipita indica DSM 11827]CCA74007.1 probable ARC35-subunit of the Arp2/3 complex [Serendipita indica DSM 11827]